MFPIQATGSPFKTENNGVRYDSFRHHRKSIRIRGYDYGSKGAYFFTICTRNRECWLGNIIEAKVELSAIGKIAVGCWNLIPIHFPHVVLDEFVVMPDHVHGIAILCPSNHGRNPVVGVQNFEPLRREHRYQHIIPKSIGSIIRTFKSGVTNWCRQNGFENFQWQRNYYEHIIRNDGELTRIRQYIRDNPQNWDEDPENPMFW